MSAAAGSRQAASAPPPQLFFIVGRGRSGTTLLSRMLSSHPALAVAAEGFFVANLEARYGRGRWDEARIERFCRDLVAERRMARWELPLPALRHRLRALGPGVDYATVCATVYRSYAEDCAGKVHVRAVGDKNPHYALLLPRLLRRFPQARFIHVVRDPRDNVLSYRDVPFDLSETHALAERWRAYNDRILSAAASAPHRFLRVHYEGLLQAPEATLTAACRFLDLPYDEAMLRFFERPMAGFYGAGNPWHRRLQTPLDSTQLGRFRGRLTGAEVAAIEHICGPTLIRLGYAPAGPTAPALSLHQRALRRVGWASVWAEEQVFATLPMGVRVGLINAYRKATGRI